MYFYLPHYTKVIVTYEELVDVFLLRGKKIAEVKQLVGHIRSTEYDDCQ